MRPPGTRVRLLLVQQHLQDRAGFFSIWRRLLTAIPGAVLWLLDANDLVMDNLRGEAGARGVDPNRLVFAPRLPSPEHLARHRLADLFLALQRAYDGKRCPMGGPPGLDLRGRHL